MPQGPKGLIRHRRHDRTVTLCAFDRLDSRNADDMSVKIGAGLREFEVVGGPKERVPAWELSPLLTNLRKSVSLTF